MATATHSGFYTDHRDTSRSYDFYPPLSVSVSSPAPLLIYIHGGAWRFGDKEVARFSPSGVHKLRIEFTQAGFAVASINYRLSHEAKFPAQLHDVKAAVRFFRTNAEHFNIDPAHIFAAGGSAGGHLTMLLAGTANHLDKYLEGEKAEDAPSSAITAGLSIYGVSDLRTIFDDRVALGMPYDHPEDDGAEWRLLGSTYPAPTGTAAEKAWASAHPLDYAQTATTGYAPLYLIHGTGDTCVPWNQSSKIHSVLQRRGIDTELVLVDGAEHGDSAIYADAHRLERAVAWAQKHIEE
ncbi:alpha/beta hydrolase [Rothia sp. ZJ1223]|uniref:alpha/beta hydrolase n=1 Tax=Rothia sp. ZJ1223 TaxID=2811098 RepID=UPI001955F5C9|nr:alpha/beta hydrolase [Rothia sp. ZJ1223]MBM7051010.1 alpha/beta hydrolase [Rothia sp. ZJ1223]